MKSCTSSKRRWPPSVDAVGGVPSKTIAPGAAQTGRAMMAYPHRNPYGVQRQYPTQSSAAYGGYGPQYPNSADGAANQRTYPATQLVWAVLVLGLATYLVSYAAFPQADGTGWGVRFSMLAAVVAALGLLPRQSTQTTLV